MAYSLNTDVIDEFKKINTTDLVTTAKIDAWIAQADAYINGRIGLLYVTPITGTDSLLIVKQISIGLVAGRIKRLLKTKSAAPEATQEFPDNLISQAKADLEMIVNKKLKLHDAVLASTDGGIASHTSENDVERCFKQGVDQW